MISLIYFMLPAYLANMAPPLLKKVNFLNYPIHEKLLGSHKTYRGLIFAVIVGMLIFYIQKILFQYALFKNISLINYSEYSLLLGFLLASGAMFGDIVKSFVKRRANIMPGERFIPWDQLDFVFGALIFSYFLVPLSFINIILILIISFALVVIVKHIGYYLKVNEKRW